MAEEQTTTTNEGQPAPQTTEASSATVTAEEQPTTETTAEATTTEAPAEETAEVESTEPTPPKAPEEYDLNSPDGVELDRDLMKVFGDLSREQDFSNEIAQKWLDRWVPALQAQQQSAIEAVHKEWDTALKADPDIGGEKLPETMRNADRFLDTYPGAKEVHEMLDATGLGKHPAFVGLFNWAGTKLTPETKIVRGTAGGGDPRNVDPIQRLAEAYDRTD